MSPFITITKLIHPTEADSIAQEFRTAVREAELISPQVKNVASTLNGYWSGNAKNIFDSHFNPVPGKVDSYISFLIQCASEIEAIQVEIEEEIWVDDPPNQPSELTNYEN